MATSGTSVGHGAFDSARYAAEAERRWGGSPSFQASVQRTRRYGEDAWAAIRRESENVFAGLADLLGNGAEASEVRAMDLAETHRRHIDRWFYPCSHQMHGCLAEMYTADPRFTAYFEERGEGLATFVHDAIIANAARYAG